MAKGLTIANHDEIMESFFGKPDGTESLGSSMQMPFSGGKGFVPYDLHITPQERKILELVDREFTNMEIARIIGLKLQTVKNHMHHIFTKFGVKKRSELLSIRKRA